MNREISGAPGLVLGVSIDTSVSEQDSKSISAQDIGRDNGERVASRERGLEGINEGGRIDEVCRVGCLESFEKLDRAE